MVGEGVLGGVADQATGHSPILSITPLHTSMQAAQLMHWYCRPFADVDAGGADLDAQAAVDAAAQAQGGRSVFLEREPRGSPRSLS